jgi:hypothetical protein
MIMLFVENTTKASFRLPGKTNYYYLYNELSYECSGVVMILLGISRSTCSSVLLLSIDSSTYGLAYQGKDIVFSDSF